MLPLHLYARVRISLCINAHETAGAARTRSSLRPLLRARLFANLGHSVCCENEDLRFVVPAHAGTHHPWRFVKKEGIDPTAQNATPRRMGPRVRGDDSRM